MSLKARLIGRCFAILTKLDAYLLGIAPEIF